MSETKQKESLKVAEVDESEVEGTEKPLDYWEALVRYTDDEQGEPGEPALGEFATLQRMNITHLLNEIVRIKGAIQHNQSTSCQQMNNLQRLLHQYTDAVRDFRYLSELNKLPNGYASHLRISLEGAFQQLARPYPGTKNYPYKTTYRTLPKKIARNRDGIRELLRKYLPSRLSWTDAERRARRSDYSVGELPDVYSTFLDNSARFIVGILGGGALIVPMVIMVLHSSLTKSLVTTSVAVVLFALVLSLIFETNNQDTITATATYAAVLVVFVGTSGSAGG